VSVARHARGRGGARKHHSGTVLLVPWRVDVCEPLLVISRRPSCTADPSLEPPAWSAAACNEQRRRQVLPFGEMVASRTVATLSAPESRQPGLTGRDAALILGAVGGTAGIGAVATTPVLSSRWYRRLDKPPWQPPGPVFGPVWTVIYALIAASMLAARGRGGDQQRPLFVLFGTNLALNLAWTLIFFRGRSPLAAGVEIVALESTTVMLVVRAWPLSRLAALLLVPYAIWVAFATVLTWAIWARN
jgi:translocator protein